MTDLLDGIEAAEPVRLRTRGVILDRVRPIRWLWERRIPIGLPSLLIGEEGVGKGTLTAWVIARATRGELDGDLHGKPVRVLVIGDEDAFEPIWVPRLVAAGADLELLRTLDDGEHIDDLNTAAEALENAIRAEEIGFVVFDALIDQVPAGDNGGGIYNPKAVRQALQPLRRISAAQAIAAIGLMHPIKGAAGNFRQLVAGSHQFNAVSRSSLLLALDPEDESNRILVRGKGNHSAAPRSIEFAIRPHIVHLNDHAFEVPCAENLVEGDRTVNDLLKRAPTASVLDQLAEQLDKHLSDEPQSLASLARAADRDPKDGSVRNALNKLKAQDRAEKVAGGWKRKIPGPVQGASALGALHPCTPEGHAATGAPDQPTTHPLFEWPRQPRSEP